jgi:hypothetical protein
VHGDEPGPGVTTAVAAEVSAGSSRPEAAEQMTAPQPRRGRIRSVPLALVAILIAQGALSLHFLRANTASTDEALYLWAGHLEVAHWLHGAAVPLFPTYFSGAPVLYPPVGALADSIGGLAGARILSLCFMLGATALLWGTTSRLYGRPAGFFASALWAFLGPTLMLGAYATYDPMSLFLLALAAWCATAHSAREEATGWMVAATTALALANAAKYASAIFDPEIIALAVLAKWPRQGRKVAFRRGALIATCTFGMLYLAIRFAGPYYRTGISQTTLTRVSGPDSVGAVLGHAGLWVGLIFAIACAGVALAAARRHDRYSAPLLAVLAAGALLAPAEQARIHTLTSLNKHAAFGAWFAAIAAGYAIDKAAVKLKSAPWRTVALAAAGAAIAATVTTGFAQAQALFSSWPRATGYVNALRPIVARTQQPVLAEISPLATYYLPSGSHWSRWSNTYGIQLASGATVGYSPGKANTAGDPASYASLISRGYFAVIALNFGATPVLDQDIEADISRNPGYHIVGWSTYDGAVHPIWAYEGAR